VMGRNVCGLGCFADVHFGSFSLSVRNVRRHGFSLFFFFRGRRDDEEAMRPREEKRKNGR
jgi:hypothetical protein